MNLAYLRILIAAILLIIPLSIWPQETDEFRTQSITTEYVRIERGLSQNSVYTILQDSEGFLWVGTWSGLNRFDGYQFRVLQKNVYQPTTGLTNPTILALAEDTLGHIWAATPTGLNRIRKSDFSVSQFTTENSLTLGLITDTLTTLFASKKGQIWIGSNQGVMILDPATSRLNHIEHNPRNIETISSNQINCFEEDTAGRIWIGTQFGLNRLNLENGQIIRYLPDESIHSLESDPFGNLWIGTQKNLYRYSLRSRKLEAIKTGQNISGIRTLFFYNNQLWIGTESNGTFLLDPLTNLTQSLKSKVRIGEPNDIPGINTIIADHNGLIWLGTNHQGMIKVIPDPYAFSVITQQSTIYGVIEVEPDVLWLGSREGVLEIDRTNGISRIVASTKHPAAPISDDRVNNLILDDQWVWVCTHNGLNRIDRKNKTLRIFDADDPENPIAGSFIWDVLKDADNTYWFATQTGISHWDPATDRITNHRHIPGNPNSLSNNFCLDLFQPEPEIILVSTQHGLNKFNTKTGSWTAYLPIPGDLTSISSSYIFGVFKDAHNDIWVYTNGGGIARFDSATGIFMNYGTFEGLPDNIVYGMSEDRDGILWLITNNGLCRFDPSLERFSQYDVNDGLISNEFNINGLLKLNNGEMIACGVNGAISFFPNKTWRTTEVPKMQISRFQVHLYNEVFDMPVYDTIRLESDENTFSIEFSSMDYLFPFKHQYQYQLFNYDRDWTRLTSGQHQAEYRKVKPGLYRFVVKGTNSLGIEGTPKEVFIRIIPAWYQTLLFKLSASILALALIGFLILLRLIHLRNRHEMEKQLLTTQNDLIRSQKFALRSQMNPHFIFNSLNSIQNFVLKNDVDSANYYLSNFSSLMRKVLEYSQYNFITLAEEFELINLYLKMEKLRFSKKFDINISIDPSIDQHLVKIPPMLLQPYLENAILHGLQLIQHPGHLVVRVADKGEFMEITIHDNGIGREKARAIRQRTGHKSKGLDNIEKRIHLYNKISIKPLKVQIDDLKDDSGNPSGTLVTLTVPYEMEDQPDQT